ncbi:MAG: hypothetical protein R3F61_10745 [Myxococcota bacterium]
MQDDIKYDVRLVRHHIRRQKITQKDLDAHLEKLADDASHGTETETRFGGVPESRRED